MYEDSHINQVSFTPYRHPTEYLRCDIHHVGDMQPQKAHSRTQTHTHKTHSPLPEFQQSNTPSPHQQTANQQNTLPTLTPKEDPCVINALCLGWPSPISQQLNKS